MLRGPGRWVYQARDRWVLGSGQGRCQVYEDCGQWISNPGPTDHQDGGWGVDEIAQEPDCPACAATAAALATAG